MKCSQCLGLWQTNEFEYAAEKHMRYIPDSDVKTYTGVLMVRVFGCCVYHSHG